MTRRVPFVSNFGNQGPGHPTSGVIGLSAEDPNLRSAYIYQYNFGIQRELGNDFSIEADYQGSNAHKLMVSIDQNQPFVTVNDLTKGGKVAPNEQVFPYPTFARLTMGKDIATSNYNGLVLTSTLPGPPRYLPAGLLHLRQIAGRQLFLVGAERATRQRRRPAQSETGLGTLELRPAPSRGVHLCDRRAGGPRPPCTRVGQPGEQAGIWRLADFRHHDRAERRALYGLQQLDGFQRIQPDLGPPRRDRHGQATAG